MSDIQQLTQEIASASRFTKDIQSEVKKVIVGQSNLIHRLLIGLLSGGHLLLEGVPGLAKTMSVKALADSVSAPFQRIQFTPDLLPADLLGTLIYNQKTGEFITRKGPIFTNLVLADEINRAPAKVQSALLEAMQEKQVTIGNETFPLSEPFLVLATQNPIEQEGTYPLPEAQMDRFLMKVRVGYPTAEEEREILIRMGTGKAPEASAVVKPEEILEARKVMDSIYMDEKVMEYIIAIIQATRSPSLAGLKDLAPLISFGASPRGTLSLSKAARGNAFLEGRGYVTPEDVREVCLDCLRHRIILTYEAEAEEVGTDEVIQQILNSVEIP